MTNQFSDSTEQIRIPLLAMFAHSAVQSSARTLITMPFCSDLAVLPAMWNAKQTKQTNKNAHKQKCTTQDDPHHLVGTVITLSMTSSVSSASYLALLSLTFR